MTKTTLDFIIIGAQKAGTTSLFRYLQPHPEFYLLPEKEAPFFSNDSKYALGWARYLQEHFADAPEARLWGKATPDYMADPRVPERMAALLPEIKLIALLREPVGRAYSHYLMSVRKGIEDRSFAEAVARQLEPDALEEARTHPTPTNSYVVRGEYVRILVPFFERYGAAQIRLFLTNELEEDAYNVVRRIFEFLEVESSFIPPNLDVIYHKGGSERRFPWIDVIKRQPVVRAVWQLLPASRKRAFSYWFHMWNVVPTKDKAAISPVTCDLLKEHYQRELIGLSGLLGYQPEW